MLIALAAFGLRLALVGYGLPLLLYEDEPIYYRYALDFGLGNWHTDYFKKPGFFLYFYAFFYGLGYGWQTLFSAAPPAHWRDYVEAFQRDPAYIATIGRVVSVTLAAATVYRLGRLGTRLFGWAAGLTAALWLAADMTHLRISPVVIADIPALFCIVTAAWFAVDVYETGRWRDYLLCALFIALAMSFKYNVFTVSFLLAAHGFGRWKDAGPSWRERRSALLDSLRFRVALMGVPVIFLLLNPMILLHFSAFRNDLTLEKNHMLLRYAQAKPEQWRAMAAFPAIFFRILPKALGWPVYLLGLAGIPWLLWPRGRYRAVNWVIFSFPLVFLAVVLQFQLINAKYLLPILVFWYLAAAVLLKDAITGLMLRIGAGFNGEGLQAPGRRTSARSSGWLPPALCVPLTAIACACAVLLPAIPSWVAALRQVDIHTRPDTRRIAAQALRAQARPGDRVLLEPNTLTLDPRVIRSGWQLQIIRTSRINGSRIPSDGLLPSQIAHSPKDIEHCPRYVLVNPGEARKARDAAGRTVYAMPYPAGYYRALRQHYRLKAVFSPYPIHRSPSLIQRQWETRGFPGLYADIRRHKGDRLQPGPLLALMERRTVQGSDRGAE